MAVRTFLYYVSGGGRWSQGEECKGKGGRHTEREAINMMSSKSSVWLLVQDAAPCDDIIDNCEKALKQASKPYLEGGNKKKEVACSIIVKIVGSHAGYVPAAAAVAAAAATGGGGSYYYYFRGERSFSRPANFPPFPPEFPSPGFPK